VPLRGDRDRMVIGYTITCAISTYHHYASSNSAHCEVYLRDPGNIWYTRRRKTKQKHNTICAGHHYPQTNTNNMNKTRKVTLQALHILRTNNTNFILEFVFSF
jgi:hypothetical protein